MWVAIVIAVIALLMVAFMPKPNIENARAAKLGDFQIARAKWGDPTPLAWGRVRQKSPITLWFGDLKPVAITKKVKDGLFSSKRVTVGYKYYLGLDLLLACGPGIKLRRIWSGTKEVWSGLLTVDSAIAINLPDLFGGEEERGGLVGTIRFYTGAYNTTQNAYLQSVLDPDVPSYNGKARCVFEGFYFGTSTSIGNLSFEIEYHPNALMPSTALLPNGADINPFEICYDGITNRWARFGNSEGEIDIPSWQACAQTAYNEGLGASMLLQSAITGKDFLEEIMRHVDGVLYQDTATSKIMAKLIRNDYDIATLPVLDESIVESISSLSKTTWENTFNQCRVQFKDRENLYDESVAVTQDFANINFQNRVKSTDISMPLCFVADNANKLSARQLSFLSVPLYKCELVCNRKASALRPGSVFKLNWAPYGLTGMVMRVSKINLGTLESGKVKITCVQDRYANVTPVFAPPAVSGFTPITGQAMPITFRKIMEAPYWFSKFLQSPLPDAQAMLMVLAEPPSTSSVSFSADYTIGTDVSWSNPIRVLGDAPYYGMGTLSSAYTATPGRAEGVDAVGFTVTGINFSDLVDSATTYDNTGEMLLIIDSEIMSAADAVNNGGGSVTFTGVRRALLDTDFENHASGAACYVIRQSDGILENLFADAATWKVRLLDKTFNSFLSGANANSDSITTDRRAFRPAPPDYVTINGSRTPPTSPVGDTLSIAWRARDRKSPLIREYNHANETPEPGTDWGWMYRVDGGAWSATTYTALQTASIVSPPSGLVEVRVVSRRDGLLSWSGDSCYVNVAAPVFTQVFFDTFDTDSIANYTEIGDTDATWTIGSGAALASGGLQSKLYVTGLTIPKGKITAVMTEAVDSGIVARLTNVNNYYLAAVYDASSPATPNLVRLYKRVSGAYTLLGSSAISFTRGTSHTLELQFDGNALTVKFDGLNVISATDSAFTTGYIGLRHGGSTPTNFTSVTGYTLS